MERSLLKELTDKRLKAYLKGTPNKPRLWPTLFPLDYSDELTWESLNANGGGTIVADVVSYDSAAPEKGRQIIGKATGEIHKITVKRSMREKDFLMYKRLKKGALGDTEKEKILNLVYGDVDFVVEAVSGRNESMALQAASCGQISFNKQNNNGIITETAVSLGVPKENKLCVKNLLSDKTTFDLFAEFKRIKKASKKTGTVRYAWMDEDTFSDIMDTDKVRASYGFYLTKTKTSFEGDIFLEDINALLSKQKLPQIIIVEDSDLIFEDDDHKRTELEAWKKGYIAFTIDKKFGRTQHGPIAEEDAESVKKHAIQAKKGHVLVTKWSEVDPVCEKTKGEAHCFPVIDSPETVYYLNTNSKTVFIEDAVNKNVDEVEVVDK